MKKDKAYKAIYKDLRKNLKNSFDKLPYGDGYNTVDSVKHWIKQHCKKYSDDHFHIVCQIMGSVPYPYQKKDRKIILKYLKNNKKLVV